MLWNCIVVIVAAVFKCSCVRVRCLSLLPAQGLQIDELTANCGTKVLCSVPV